MSEPQPSSSYSRRAPHVGPSRSDGLTGESSAPAPRQPPHEYGGQHFGSNEPMHISDMEVRAADIPSDTELMVGVSEARGRSDAEFRTGPRPGSTGHSATRTPNRPDSDLPQNSITGIRERMARSPPARDRKRRLTSAGEMARLQRTRSSETEHQSDFYARRELPHRSASMLVSSRREPPRNTPSAVPGSSYSTAIDITSSPPRPSRTSFSQADSPSRSMDDGDGDWNIDVARRRPGPGPSANGSSNNGWSISPSQGSASSRARQALSSGNDEPMDMTMPRWQPDAEVTSCPICGTVFSFWYRKHHCRKCGRVVCASCSPHRITIPRQYIVRPPDSFDLPQSSITPSRVVVDLTEDDPSPSTSTINPALGGGEEVRLCNPCVPDPNPNPLRYTAIRSRGHRSTHSLSSAMGNAFSSVRGGFHPDEMNEETGPFEDPGRRTRNRPRHRHYRQLFSDNEQPQPQPTRPRRATALPGVTAQRQPPPPPSVPQRPAVSVSEQDLCPVCGRGFPALSDEQPLEAREAHVRHCIESYGAPAARRDHHSGRQGPPPPPPPPAAARMVDFTATEKDCLSGDGNIAECTICMEDYEVGQALARLECLCKFHKHCIVDWFSRKMECPVHKVS